MKDIDCITDFSSWSLARLWYEVIWHLEVLRGATLYDLGLVLDPMFELLQRAETAGTTAVLQALMAVAAAQRDDGSSDVGLDSFEREPL